MIAVVSSELAQRWIIGGTLGVLVVASLIGLLLKRNAKSDKAKLAVSNLNARTTAWWVMAAILGFAVYIGIGGATILFAILSFLALREMLTLAPTRRADHETMFWAFFVMIPIQYYLVYIPWYGMYTIFIPIYCFLFIAIRIALAGDCTDYLSRAAKIQWGVFICVYCVSHMPAILTLNMPSFGRYPWEMLVWFVIVVQMSDVFQYVWGKLLGKHKVAPTISPNKTWEGLIGGVLSATALGVGLYAITPFTLWQAARIGFIVAILGFFGGVVMSAIKRDAGVKDYGHTIPGHGGVMDRIDSLAFAAPVFFHVVRYWFT